MTGKLPRLHPGHKHQWTEPDRMGGSILSPMAVCLICGFTVPRNLAKLDGTPTPPEKP